VGNIHKNLIGAVAPIGAAELRFKPSGSRAQSGDEKQGKQTEASNSHHRMYIPIMAG
jgi:hypothetical protein